MLHPGRKQRTRRGRRASRLGPALARLPWIGAVLLMGLLLAVDTDAGRDLLARALTAASGGQVRVHGIGGELPWRLRIERLELADVEGVWLRADDLALVARPESLLRGELDIAALTADRVDLVRVPGSGAGNGAGFRLPLSVRVGRLVIPRLSSTALGRHLPALTVTGSAGLSGAGADADLLLTVPGRRDRYGLTLATRSADHRLSVAISEAPDGPLATLARSAGLPLPRGLADWTLSATADGPLHAAAVDADLAAGPYRASANGVIDLPAGQLSALAVRLEVASMAFQPAGMPRPLRWRSMVADAVLDGPWRAPRARLRASVTGFEIGSAALAQGAARSASEPAASPSNAEVPVPYGQTDDPVSTTAAVFADALQLEGDVDLAGSPLIEANLRLRQATGEAAGAADSPASRGAPAGPAADVQGGQVQGRLVLEPAASRGRLVLDGRWDGEPVAVDLEVEPLPGDGLALRLNDGRWGRITLAGRLGRAVGARLPAGELRLGIPRLEAAAPVLLTLLGPRLPFEPDALDWTRVEGGLDARLELDGDARVRLTADGTALQFPLGPRLGALVFEGSLEDPFGTPRAELDVRVTDITAPGLAGRFSLHARGPLDAWDLDIDAGLRIARPGAAAEDDTRIVAAGRVDLAARRLALATLRVEARDRRLTLLAPAAVDFGAGLALESIRLGLSAGRGTDADTAAGGTLELAGQIAPRLSLDARLAGLDLGAAAPLLPPAPWAPEGVIAAEARLTGSLAAPTGQVSARAGGLGFARAARLGLPRADAQVTLTLEPTSAWLAAEAGVGKRARMGLEGRIGGALWSADAPLELRGSGELDLALLDAWLGAAGRRAQGRVRLDLDMTGTRGAPSLTGRVSIADGSWRDRRLGLSLEGIAGDARLRGDRLDIERLVARAGAGSLELAGGIGWRAPGRPVDLRLRARDAEPIRLDLLGLRGDADLALRGALGGNVSLGGDLRFDEVAIRLPEQMPADVPRLDVVELGERRQPRPPPRPPTGRVMAERLRVDVRIDAPGAVRVRGRNIDAELGGSVNLRGSAAALVAEGGFTLVRGHYEIIGQPLRFTRGRIGLDGGDLLDPTLDFEARAAGSGATAILAVEGRARSPRVELRGEPPMPDDEVLSRLLFGVPPARLTAFQLTRLGLAATSIAGVGIDGSGLLGGMRAGLGLERLRVDSDRRGDAVVEGGRNLGERVYLGARQGISGGEPRGVLGLKLAPQIRFESDVGARGVGAGAAFELEY